MFLRDVYDSSGTCFILSLRLDDQLFVLNILSISKEFIFLSETCFVQGANCYFRLALMKLIRTIISHHNHSSP